MENIALRKSTIEKVRNPESITDGNIDNYTGRTGFSSFHWPGYLTLDLEKSYEIKTIRFLLWDGLGKVGTVKATRLYKYRLLLSEDLVNWKVIYDTASEGFTGWQCFEFIDSVPARYVRIHGLWNSNNEDFHIIQIEAYEDLPKPYEKEYALLKKIDPNKNYIENNDGLSISEQINNIINGIENLINPNNILNPIPFNQLTKILRTKVDDISNIEKNAASIRREILQPVQKELEISSKFGRFSIYGFWVGIIGGILAIISIIISLFH